MKIKELLCIKESNGANGTLIEGLINGYRVAKTYIGYTKKEAVKKYIEELPTVASDGYMSVYAITDDYVVYGDKFKKHIARIHYAEKGAYFLNGAGIRQRLENFIKVH